MSNEPIPSAESTYGGRVAAAKQRHILDAAVEAFAYRGYSHATMKDVAEKAGVSAGTIYNHFRNKEELLLAILDRINESDERPEAFEQGADEELSTFLTRYIAHRLEAVFHSAKLFQAVFPELMSNARLRARYYEQVIDPTMRIAKRFVADEISRGRMRTVDPTHATRLLAGSVLGILVQYLLGDVDVEAELSEIAATASSIISSGLVATGPAA
jgi:AcrR family transcriptional regulator